LRAAQDLRRRYGPGAGTSAAGARDMARIEPWSVPLMIIVLTAMLVAFVMTLVVVMMH
jgi:hypothetical protein